MPQKARTSDLRDVASYLVAKRASRTSATSTPTPTPEDLATRLRAIVGPVPDVGSAWKAQVDGQLNFDGLVTHTGDRWFFVTTPDLLRSWQQPMNSVGLDPLEMIRSEDALTWVFDFNAHLYKYADLSAAARLPDNVLFAFLVQHSQDIGDTAPDKTLVGMMRGHQIYIILDPASAIIPVPKQCLEDKQTRYKGLGRAGSMSRKDDEAIQVELQACYARLVSTGPGFEKIVAQVHDLSRAIPDTSAP